MPIFRYKAMNEMGSILQGTFSASNHQEVVSMLRQRNSYPVLIEEERSQDLNLRWSPRVGVREISIFCRQFYSMLNAGVNIMNCLDILRSQVENKKLGQVVSKLYEDVQKGMTLSEAMKHHRKIFPNLLISMVEAGEVSGTLDTIMKRMASHYEKEYKLNNKVTSAMVYPFLLAVVAVTVVVFLLTFVMPTFIGMFSSSGVQLPLPTRILIGFSDFLVKYIFFIVLALVLGGAAFLRYSGTKEGRWRIDSWKLQIPIIKGLSKKITASRFTRTLSTLMGSGIPLLQALESVGAIVGNVVVEDAIGKIRDDVRRGKPLATPIQASGMFPPMVDNMIRIGEETGTLDELLDKSADFFDEELDIAIQRMTTMFEPVMIVIMGVVIGAIVIAMVLPMFDMINTM